MPLFAAILLLVVLGLSVLAIVLTDRKLSASDFRCLSLALGLQGVLLLVYYFLHDQPPLAMSWHAALFVSLVFPLPMMGYTWALDRLSFAGRLPHIVRAFALSFSGVLLTVISLIGWVFVWFISMIILHMLGILPNDSHGV